MKIYRTIQQTRQQAQDEIAVLQEKLAALPTDKLTCRHYKNKNYWYVFKPGTDKQRYLTRDKEDYAVKLGLRYVLQAKLEDCERTVRSCDAFERQLMRDAGSRTNPVTIDGSRKNGGRGARTDAVSNTGRVPKNNKSGNAVIDSVHGSESELWLSAEESLFARKPYLRKLIPAGCNLNDRAKQWMTAEYPRLEQYADQKTHTAPDGTKMRSKSEVSIATALLDAGIAYRYECALDLNGTVIYPDFTILDEQNNCVRFWEHFGLMDNAQYAANAAIKVSSMVKCGYLPGRNLILTGETKDHPFESEDARRAVEFYFL